MFVAANILLSQQIFVQSNVIFSRQNVCVASGILLSRQKTYFVATNTCLSQQTRVCRDKNDTCGSARQ